jgi:hypothetical protein
MQSELDRLFKPKHPYDAFRECLEDHEIDLGTFLLLSSISCVRMRSLRLKYDHFTPGEVIIVKQVLGLDLKPYIDKWHDYYFKNTEHHDIRTPRGRMFNATDKSLKGMLFVSGDGERTSAVADAWRKFYKKRRKR